MAKKVGRLSLNQIENRILLVRGHKIILDSDLAELYEVETKALNRAVKRHLARFPKDFMFQLTAAEFTNLRRQVGTSTSWGGRRYAPLAFTEQGVAMLSRVLNSSRAIQVNVAIMRVFVRLREMMTQNDRLGRNLTELEQRLTEHDGQILAIVRAIRELTNPRSIPKPRRIGFRVEEDAD